MALKVHGCSAITCITAQNSKEVKCVEPVEKNTLLSQLDTLFADFGIDALKTGMLLNERIINDDLRDQGQILFCKNFLMISLQIISLFVLNQSNQNLEPCNHK